MQQPNQFVQGRDRGDPLWQVKLFWLHNSLQLVLYLLLALFMDISVLCWWTPDLSTPSCRSGSPQSRWDWIRRVSLWSPHLALSGHSGEQLTAVGLFVAHLVIGAAECRYRVSVVRGLQYDCLVGRDLLSTIPCSIVSDGNGHLTFVSTPTRVCTIQPVCADILVKQSVQIPPRSQQIVMGRVRRKGGGGGGDRILF